MGAPLTLTRDEYKEGLETIEKIALDDVSYLDQFKINFPDGLNTANSLEICRAIQDPSLESKVRIAKICIAGKTVEIVCPNGEKQKFCIKSPTDNLEAFPIFQEEPLATMALADIIYGHLLKKSVRLSKTGDTAAAVTTQ